MAHLKRFQRERMCKCPRDHSCDIMTGKKSAEVPPSCVLSKAFSGLVRIWSAKIPWKIIQPYLGPKAKMPQLTQLLLNCLLVQTSHFSCWERQPGYVFLPLKISCFHSQHYTLFPKYLNIVPAGWNKDFQFSIHFIWVVISAGFSITIFCQRMWLLSSLVWKIIIGLIRTLAEKIPK